MILNKFPIDKDFKILITEKLDIWMLLNKDLSINTDALKKAGKGKFGGVSEVIVNYGVGSFFNSPFGFGPLNGQSGYEPKEVKIRLNF